MYRSVLFVCLAGVWGLSPAWAQFETATVLGTVRDATGSAVPSCNVTLEGVDTGISARTLTDGDGNYQFFNVKIGRYRVQAVREGFKTAASETFAVAVSARQRVDLRLEVGDVAESVTVTEAAALLETDTSARGTVIGRKQIEDLPLNGRAYADLTLLTPGTSQAQRGLRDGRDASYHVNGLRSSYNNFTLDGVENNAYGTSNQGFSNQVVQVSPDAVGEFKVTTNNFSAEYGRAGGAVIVASLRSGTNDLHFTLWQFLRNTKLNAVGFFKPQFGKPTLIQNQFGAAAGAPIVRNKTFFFADYEGLRRVEKSLVFADLPTAEMRQGIFSGVALADPYSGTPVPGGRVPASQVTPFARRVLDDLPQPNRPGAGRLGIGSNFESLPAKRVPDDKGNFKIDHYFSSRLTSFFRYSQRELNQFEPPNIPGPSGGNSNGNVFVRNRAFAAGTTYSLTPTTLAEFRLGFTQTDGGKSPVNAGAPPLEETYGIRGVPRDPRVGGGLNTHSVTGYTQFGRQSSNPQFQNPDVLNPRVNLSTIVRAHTLKFGYEHQRIATEINDLGPVLGRSNYAGQFSRAPGAAATELYNLADFLVGAQSQLELSTFEVLDYRQRMHFFYLQDDWKVSPKLTLNLGLRYEFATPQWDAQNRLGNFDPAGRRLIFAKNGSLFDRALVDPDFNNLGPRVGGAYQLTSKTVVRGGFGVSYIHFNRMGGENILGFTGPFVIRVTQPQIAPGVASGGQPLCAAGQTRNCFVRTQDGFPADFLDKAKYDPSRSRVNYTPRELPTGSVQSWHLTIQRQLASDLALDLAYVGNRGRNLMILGDFNQARPNELGQSLGINQRRPIPGFSEIQISTNIGESSYHSFQAKIEKRYAQGFFLLNSFTWSKAIDNAAGHLETYNGDNSRVNLQNLASERGLSSYDLRLNNVSAVIWDLPYGRGRRWGSGLNPVLNGLLGGWRTTLINSLRSGIPVNLIYSAPAAFQVFNGSPRPNISGPVETADRNIFQHFIRANISQPTDVRFPFGNAGRNIARTRGFAQADFGLYKQFPLRREGSRLEFRSEFFNLFNRTNFREPNSNVSSGSFGQVTANFPPRQIQFALKLYY